MNFADFLSRLSEDYPVPDSYIAENTEIFHVQELSGQISSLEYQRDSLQ